MREGVLLCCLHEMICISVCLVFTCWNAVRWNTQPKNEISMSSATDCRGARRWNIGDAGFPWDAVMCCIYLPILSTVREHRGRDWWLSTCSFPIRRRRRLKPSPLMTPLSSMTGFSDCMRNGRNGDLAIAMNALPWSIRF